MWRRVLKGVLVLALGAICSASVAGMLAFLLHAAGVPVGWLLAVLSVAVGLALGFTFARSLSVQVPGGSDEAVHQRRGKGSEV